MIPNASIDDLATRIRARTADGPDTGRGPYVLLLGDGCARAAGVPSLEALARTALRRFALAKDVDSLSDAEAVNSFLAATATMKPAHLSRVVQSIFASIPVPSFYQHLAELIRARFFPLVMTTSYDTLLEQALAGIGLRPFDYRVTTFGRETVSTSTGGDATDLVHIVKLHGDLARDVVHFTPEAVESALRSSRAFLKSELRSDLIMVGHTMGDDPIDRWLAHSRDRELWWVAPEPPSDRSRFESWAPERFELLGETARPQIFFPQLAIRLVRPPELEAPGDDVFEGIEPVMATAAPGLPEPAFPLADVLQGEVRRTQSLLYSLEQEAPPGLRSSSTQAQIAYQKKQMSRLEDRIRSIPDVKPKLIEIVDRILESVRHANADTATAFDMPPHLQQYLDQQGEMVKTELAKDSPNQFLVSASLGATLTLADRLLTEYGAAVVNPDDVRQLAAFAPMAAAKVVL